MNNLYDGFDTIQHSKNYRVQFELIGLFYKRELCEKPCLTTILFPD